VGGGGVGGGGGGGGGGGLRGLEPPYWLGIHGSPLSPPLIFSHHG